MKKPNLFIMGAPKCGTTSIARWLSEHNQVYVSPVKEPYHFYSPYESEMSATHYEQLFAQANSEHKVVAEASVWYLFSRTATERILDYSPTAKFVVCVRNPVEMALSLHAQQVLSGFELRTDFRDAWYLDEDRRKGHNIGVYSLSGLQSVHLAYRHTCSLGTQLELLYEQVPKERVHLILLDDLKNRSLDTWQNLLQFLEIDDDKRNDFPAHNQASANRSPRLNRALMQVASFKRNLGFPGNTGLFAPLARLNIIPRPYIIPPVEFIEEAYNAFQDEIDLLETQLDRNLSSWNAHATTTRTRNAS